MKGLLKNNFYAVYSGAKTFSAFMALLGAFVSVVVSQQLLLFYMLLGIVGFSVNAIASIGKDHISKWGKYKLTSPVRRADIVKSSFLHQLIWLLVGMAFAGGVMGLSWFLHGHPFDRDIDVFMVFAVGIGISLFSGAIFLPLFYLGGEERSGAFLAISLLCAIGAVMGIVSLVNSLFGPKMSALQAVLGAAIVLGCSLAVFSISYPFTVAIFKRREY